jgi:hypothetical protein
MSRFQRNWTLALTLVVAIGSVVLFGSSHAADDKKNEDPALERARNTVRMLDDVYKSTIVLITDKYVHTEDDYPAGSAAVELFAAIGKKGWHEVRLLDATGEPYDDDNTAQDAFEKEAVKQLKAGKPYYEQVVENDGKRQLRAATAVPVVMEKCTMCHPHYEQAKEGEPIGLISYRLTIE